MRQNQEGVQSELAENQVTEDAAHGESEPTSDHSPPSSGTEEEIRSTVTSRPVKDKKEIARAKASRHKRHKKKKKGEKEAKVREEEKEPKVKKFKFKKSN